ncbi:very short patch repair endonuclease [Chryseobacterium lactis]|uniref:very short patch repair endonuclease n=1 Tax=Chryseobacterium lactis TaxID=1241981 RepID=UPI001C896E8C
MHDEKLPCKPNVILPKYKTVIFINGCFWHGQSVVKCNYLVPAFRNHSDSFKPTRERVDA